MIEDPTPDQIIAMIERSGRQARQHLLNLDLPDKVDRLGAALDMAASPHVRQVICNLLASLADPAALPWLLKHLADLDEEVVAAAADAIGNSAFDQILPQPLRVRLGDALQDLLTTADRPTKVRTGAIYALGLLGYEPAVDALLGSLESMAPIERSSSAEALSHLPSAQVVLALRDRLRREDDARVARYVRAALRSLANTGVR